MKKLLSSILCAALILTAVCSMFTASVYAAEPVNLLDATGIWSGAENVTVNADGSWTITGPVNASLTTPVTLSYNEYTHVYQDIAEGAVSITLLDRDPAGVYQDHWINLYGQWAGPNFYPAEGYTNNDSIQGVYNWCTTNAGWLNTGLYTIVDVAFELDANEDQAIVNALYLNDGLLNYQLGDAELPADFTYDSTLDLAVKDADAWTPIPVSGSLANVRVDGDNLVLDNTAGYWPNTFIDFDPTYTIDATKDAYVKVDFSVKASCATTLYLYFGEADCNNFDNGAYGMIGTADMGGGNYTGYVKLSDIMAQAITDGAPCFDADGNIVLTGVKLFAVSNSGANDAVLTIRDLTLMYTAPAPVDEPDPFVPGDMTGDGALNMMDALLLYSGFANGTLTADQIATVADYNQDGSVNMFDSLLLYSSLAQ